MEAAVSKDEQFAAELPISVAQRKWRQVVRLSDTGPVLLTRCGEPSLVVLGVRKYQDLRELLLQCPREDL